MLYAEQVKKLHSLLSDYGRVGVAFSGGVDSSFLLKSALNVLGEQNVIVLHGRSCLQKDEEQLLAETWLTRHGFSGAVQQIVLNLDPLSWPEMATNSKDRCYKCKHRMYSLFLATLAGKHIPYLLDGTNIDDLGQHRPGLQAIEELSVKTPLVDAGLNKDAIRTLSRNLHLDTSDQPSSSCLATRIPHGLAVTRTRLEKISQWEEEMAKLGFTGCRVNMDSFSKRIVWLQVLRQDQNRLATPEILCEIESFFLTCGIEHVHITPQGR